MKFQLLIKTKMLKNKDVSVFKLSDVSIMNKVKMQTKMPTVVGILTFEHDKFHAHFSMDYFL